ncbi:MAG: septum formation initiator family protein [Deltaproteobacteria bacterium]|nr:septum formation initiator family protein [Deltaproteobacteria bacterium]MBW1960986.1 septum formation initiator family protein [Deltaproteobacteria bacterium]MBW2151549.1 septum formation initiator family protein [Deltaproteobacteria bacterium]
MDLKQKILFVFAGIFLLVLGFLIVFSDNGLMELDYLKRQRAILKKENETLMRENLALYRKVERLEKDLTYIESVARKELGVIGKDEIILKLKD